LNIVKRLYVHFSLQTTFSSKKKKKKKKKKPHPKTKKNTPKKITTPEKYQEKMEHQY